MLQLLTIPVYNKKVKSEHTCPKTLPVLNHYKFCGYHCLTSEVCACISSYGKGLESLPVGAESHVIAVLQADLQFLFT